MQQSYGLDGQDRTKPEGRPGLLQQLMDRQDINGNTAL